jgi:hypothetical protein
MTTAAVSADADEVQAGSEYERERVPEKALKGPAAFWGMYAGEHTAGTEFMIGPLFVAWGADASSLIFGLLIGNLLAVLTWRYLTAVIACDERLTLYSQWSGSPAGTSSRSTTSPTACCSVSWQAP